MAFPRTPETVGRIALRGLRVEARHGVLPQEHTRAQPFFVDLELELDLGPAGASDRLEATVDYSAAAALVAEVLNGPHRDLLEALAADIAARLQVRFPALLGGAVTVHKPEAPLGLPASDVAVTWPLPSRAAGGRGA